MAQVFAYETLRCRNHLDSTSCETINTRYFRQEADRDTRAALFFFFFPFPLYTCVLEHM